MAWWKRPTVLFITALIWYLVSYLPYLFLNRLVRVQDAVEHAKDLIQVEQDLHIPWGLYKLATGPTWTGIYEWPHLILLLAFIPALLVWAPGESTWKALAEVCILLPLCDVLWILFPVAPPWFMDHAGAMPINAGVAQFASFPSYHIAFAALVARYLPNAGKPYALAMTVVVVITGNHYVLDCAFGWSLEIAAAAVVGRVADEIWLWRLLHQPVKILQRTPA